MKVRDVIHKGATWVETSAPISQVAKKMRLEDIGAIPVGKSDRLVGMVTDRDICCRGLGKGKDARKLTAADVMSTPILYCRADQDIASALKLMKKSAIRRLPLIDAKKRMVGMLGLGDIAARSTHETAGTALRALSAHHA